MNRRMFFGTALSAGTAGFGLSCGGERLPWDKDTGPQEELSGILAGMTIENLREDYRHRLFDLYISFWENGAYDAELGGFMTSVNDDGSVAIAEKRLIDQGQALWIYSFLYNNMGEDEAYLSIAEKTRDFMVRFLRTDNGRWFESVDRSGSLREDVSENAIGWLYAAYGLSEYYRATENDEDQDIVFETLWAALRAYDSLNYGGVTVYGGMSPDLKLNGLRDLGHSILIIRLLSDFLEETRNRRLEEVLSEHIGHVMESFFNPKLGVLNTYLNHDYSRIAGYEDYMETGVAVEAAWTIMAEARRSKDPALFEDAKNMLVRFVEMGWDYVFEGFADGHYYVFDGPDRTRESLYGEKTSRSHCELMTALLHIYEYTGDEWAKTWYERVRAYVLSKFAETSPVWPLTVDRFGRTMVSGGTAEKKRDIFFQPRCLIYDLLSLDRTLEEMGKLEDLETQA